MVVMVGLDDQADEPGPGTLGLLGMLLVSDLSPEEKVRCMKEDYGMMVTEEYEERVAEMCNLSVGVRAEGRREGLKKGRRKGRKKGRKEGREETLLSAVRDMGETLGLSPEQALDALRVTDEERTHILERLTAA